MVGAACVCPPIEIEAIPEIRRMVKRMVVTKIFLMILPPMV
jgi:hypothetical protein